MILSLQMNKMLLIAIVLAQDRLPANRKLLLRKWLLLLLILSRRKWNLLKNMEKNCLNNSNSVLTKMLIWELLEKKLLFLKDRGNILSSKKYLLQSTSKNVLKKRSRIQKLWASLYLNPWPVVLNKMIKLRSVQLHSGTM